MNCASRIEENQSKPKRSIQIQLVRVFARAERRSQVFQLLVNFCWQFYLLMAGQDMVTDFRVLPRAAAKLKSHYYRKSAKI